MNDKSIFGAKPEQLNRLLTAIGLEKSDSNEQIERTDPSEPTTGKLGSRIGRYKLLSVLGEGGMGIVYLAEQQRPIKRQVALKVIKPGMDSARIISRFEAERQALALLDHPNIAHVFDAGTTEAGRPYFVMEYVNGLPITEHCDCNKLTIKDRLNLFLQVCHAVHHAHQKGIIHRDIKPSNILVSTDNDKSVPKIIDFGIAKAMNESLTERTFYTEQGQLIGTPEYMSPEQAYQNTRNIDIRTDVYSLGVVLYKLLTGLLPFDLETFRSGGIEQIRKVICEEDPMTPSMRLRRVLIDESIELARRRQTDIRRLQLTLHGDLDWITLKALEKDRARRYSSVDAFVTDISNYLRHQPVSAAPPGTLYIVRKFVRRYRQRLAVLGAAVMLLIVILWAGWAHQQVVREKTHSEALEHERIFAEAQKLFESRDIGALNTSDPSNEALALIKPILNSKHVGQQAQLLWAAILVEGRCYNKAMPVLEALCRLHDRPEIAGSAHALMARILWESRTLDGAALAEVKQHQQRAEQLLPRKAEAYYLRAMTALTMHEKLDLLDEALALEPGHYPARRLRALTHQASRQYRRLNEDALLMTYATGDPIGYSLRARALTELGRLEEAVACYDKALGLCDKETSEVVELNSQCCDVLMRMGQYERTLARARACLKTAPSATILHFHAFCALTALGKYDQAVDMFQHAIQNNPDAGIRLRDWSMKYVFDTLDAGSAWHPRDSVPEVPPFMSMFTAEATYHSLSTHAHRLVTDGFSGSWSPDGTRIAFSMGVQGYSGVAVYDLKSHETDLLIVPGKDPKWSPDGRHIAFVRDCDVLRLAEFTEAERRFQARASEQEEVWVMNADGTELRRLAHGGGWPSWSTDAKHIYYQSRGDNMLYLVSIEDSDAKPVPVIPCSSSMPSVSPDGRCVAYVQDGAFRFVDLDTRSQRAEWSICMPMRNGNWSPDGREFAFGGTDRFVEVNAGLWIYDLDKEEASQILTGQITDAAWSSDKRQLVFSLGPPYFEIWIADLDLGASTAEALGPARSVKETLLGWIDTGSRQLAIDPNLLLTHWARTAAALWIEDDRAARFLEEMGRAIDRCPDQIGLCHWSAMGTFGRPAVNRRVMQLTLLLVHKVVEQNPGYAREFAVALYGTGQHAEAARLWHINEANASHGDCQYDQPSDTYRMTGCGWDIWDRLDNFRFTYQEVDGNCSITARIDGIEHTHDWTKAGVMMRATLEPDSPNILLLVTPAGRLSLQYRREKAMTTYSTYTPVDTLQLPHWVRLTRMGQRFTTQHSHDGVTWQDVLDTSGQPSHIDIPMGETILIGLAATSHDATHTAKARFSHVTTTGRSNPPGPFTSSCDIPREFPPTHHE